MEETSHDDAPEGPGPDEAALALRESKLAEVFERSSNAMLIADDHRVYTGANRAAMHLLRLPLEGIVGRRIDDLAAPSSADAYEYIRGDGQAVPFDFSATVNVLPGRHLIILLPRGSDLAAAGPGPAPAGAELTPREREVLRMVALGNTGQEIAAALMISPETVSTHMRNIREKLGARSRAHAIAVALRRGEIDV